MSNPFERKLVFQGPLSKTVFVESDHGDDNQFNWEATLTTAHDDPYFSVQSELVSGDSCSSSVRVAD